MIRSRTEQRRLPPLQTGRADFPHPACPRTPRSKACVDRRRLGRRTETLPRNEVGRSLFWEQRSMCILTPFARRVLGRAPSLHGHYPASSLLRAPPTPDRAVARLWVPLRLVDASPKCESPLERVSQVPDDSVGIRRPLSPRRARPLQAFVASRSMTGFTPPGGLATLTCLTRPNSGSRLRITADAFAFRGSDRRITLAAARSATWRTNNYHGQYLSTDKNRQASPDAPGGNKGNGEIRTKAFVSLCDLCYLLFKSLSFCLSLVSWGLGGKPALLLYWSVDRAFAGGVCPRSPAIASQPDIYWRTD